MTPGPVAAAEIGVPEIVVAPPPPRPPRSPMGVASKFDRGARWFTVARVALVAAIAIGPLLFIPSLGGVLPLVQQSTILLLIVIACIATVIGVLCGGALPSTIFPRIAWLGLALAGLGLTASIAATPGRRMAFWGTDATEVDTVIPLLLGLVACILAAVLLRERRHLRRAFTAIHASILISLGLVAANHVALLTARRPVFGTPLTAFNAVGSMNVYAVFLAAAVILAFRGFADSVARADGRLRALVAVRGALPFLALIAIGHRDAFFALAAGAVVFLAGWFAANVREVMQRLIRLNIALAVISAAFLFAVFDPTMPSLGYPVEVRPSHRTSWTVAAGTIGEGMRAAFIGSGPGTYTRDFAMHRPLAVNRTILSSTDFGQGASYWWTILPTFGLLPTFGFLLFLGAILVFSVRTIMRDRMGQADHVMRSTALAFAVVLLVASFLYPLSPILLLSTFTAFGLLAAASASEQRSERTAGLFRSPARAFAASLAMSGIAVLAIAMLIIGSNRLIAGTFLMRANAAIAQPGDRDVARSTARAFVQRAQAQFPSNASAQSLASLWAAELAARLASVTKENAAARQSDVAVAFTAAVDAARAAIALRPSDHRTYALLGSVYAGAMGFVTGADDAAIAAYEQASRLNVTSPTYFLEIAKMHLLRAGQQTGAAGTASLGAAKDAIAAAQREEVVLKVGDRLEMARNAGEKGVA